VTFSIGVERLEARDLPAASVQTLPILPFNNLEALDHARATFALGQQLGRRSDVVLKIGDSNSSPIFTPNYLAPLGSPTFNPVASGLSTLHANLLAAWWAFRSGPDSLAHEGPTAQPGWQTGNVLGTLAGEINATNPAIALVMIGTNDAMVSGDAAGYRDRLSLIVTQLLAGGVVPVLSTLPDSHYQSGKFESTLMVFNQVIATVAEQFAVPLWNVWAALDRLPNQGLSSDGVHLAASPNGPAGFWPVDLLFGQNVRNLQALQILDWFQERVAGSITVHLPKQNWQPIAASQPVYAVGRDRGSASIVEIYNGATGERLNAFLPFRPSSSSGVRVATGDINGDGFADIVCASGGIVKVISGADGTTLKRFRPFGASRSGITIALGDLNDDGALEIVVARGGAGAIRVYDGKTSMLNAHFSAFPHRMGHVTVAVANVAGLGPAVIAGGGGKHSTIRSFNPQGQLISEFSPFKSAHQGIAVAAADLDGDGFDEIVVGRNSPAPHIRVFDGTSNALLADFALGPVIDPAFGIRLGTMRSATSADTLLVGSAPGSPVSVRGFDDLSGVPELLPLERSNRAYGIFVG
jgi:hypothetical protein